MGCDIHSLVEIRRVDRWEAVTDRLFPMAFPWNGQTHTSEPFDWRSYGMFGFLADVRNYSYVPPLAQPRGFPLDLSELAQEQFSDDSDYHSRSWLSLAELLAFDYSQTFEDRRCTKEIQPHFWNGAADAGPENGTIIRSLVALVRGAACPDSPSEVSALPLTRVPVPYKPSGSRYRRTGRRESVRYQVSSMGRIYA
jgi:hypothetical protein